MVKTLISAKLVYLGVIACGLYFGGLRLQGVFDHLSALLHVG